MASASPPLSEFAQTEIETILGDLTLVLLTRDNLNVLQSSSQKMENIATAFCRLSKLYLPPLDPQSLPPISPITKSKALHSKDGNEQNVSVSPAKPDPKESFLYYDFASELVSLIHHCAQHFAAYKPTRQKDPVSSIYLSLAANAEYTLFRISSTQQHVEDGKHMIRVRMFQLPFLRHWIEAIDTAEENATTLSKVRGELAKSFLRGQIKDVSTRTTRDLVRISSKSWTDNFDTLPYWAILQALGVADDFKGASKAKLLRSPMVTQLIGSIGITSSGDSNNQKEETSPASDPDADSGAGVSNGKPIVDIVSILASRNSSPRSSSRFDLDLLERFITQSPADASWEITHLSVDLASAELVGQLTEPETRKMLKREGIDVAQVVRDFIQHGFRLLEGIGDLSFEETNRFSSNETQSSALVGTYSADLATVAYTISLLSLLIVSIVSRRLLSASEVLWESREMLYRYPWVPEVRPLRELYRRVSVGLDDGVGGVANGNGR